jgi:glucose-6-phosphate 1-dehydrogenase
MPDATKPAPPCTLVIFGAHGDLTKRLLMPALYNLTGMGRLDPGFHVIGIDRSQNDTGDWVRDLGAAMQSFTTDRTAEFHPDHIDPGTWNALAGRLEYVQGDFGDEALFRTLAGRITGNALFYLAVAARFFGPLVDRLGGAGLLRETPDGFRRVLIEKPFGSDLPTAEALNAQILRQAAEHQFYRIDHFMGKDAVQSLLPLRFCNTLFSPVWHRDHIDHVEITAAETVGVEGRGGFYEQTGALRDMVPNHLFTILSMVAMEPPDTFGADAIRGARTRLLQAVRPVRVEDAVRGQYAAGTVQGQPAHAYRAEPDVAADSGTETYIAMKLAIENWRWAGVPFYLRTGKHLASRRTEIVIHFRPPAVSLLDTAGLAPETNTLIVGLDPEPGLSAGLAVKAPGVTMVPGYGAIRLRYEDALPAPSRDGYEGLFYGAMRGDALLFQPAAAIEAGWAAVQPVLDAPPAIEPYAAGSSGPEGADALLARAGHRWRKL